MRPGDVAVIAHRNLDRVSAEELAAAGVVAVSNCEPSSDGRYPNRGPLDLVESGVSLLDLPGDALFSELAEGTEVRVSGDSVLVGRRAVASGTRLTATGLTVLLEERRREIDRALAGFAENTVSHVREESEILTGDIALPATATVFRDRHVLIVVRGPGYRRDLRALDGYIREVRPVLVGVDGGADAIIEAGHRPDLILGDMDSASDRVLSSGAELVVHAYEDGSAPGLSRLDAAGLESVVFPIAGTSQDAAMLLAHERGASLIVSVGAHFDLVEFLEKDRDGMSSTFLTRLRIGGSLVDAKGVSRLYSPGIGRGTLAGFLGGFLLLVAVVVLASPALADLFELI
ncbi:MAG: putative cytokinetic ring protein SteA, partial [Solirubrobacterales bacterium]